MATVEQRPASLLKTFLVVLALYVVLYAVTAVHGLWLEDRYASGLAILDSASQIPVVHLALYFTGIYALQFPFGSLLRLFEPGPVVALLSTASVVPNALLLALVLRRLRRAQHSPS
jgi:hypothetical protein